MLVHLLAALVTTTSPQLQESIMPPPARFPLPRPVAGAPIAQVNNNTRAAGRLENGVLTLALDIVEVGYQPEGPHDPVVRALAFAEQGKAPVIPAPMIRGPIGTTVRLAVRNRTDTTLVMHGLRRSLDAEKDTLTLAKGATRELTFKLDKVGNFFYWAGTPDYKEFGERFWLDSQLTGAFVVDAAGSGPKPNERVWLITEWFDEFPKVQSFESALTFNGKAWPYNERLTFTQNDSVHFRIINAAAVDHPLHLHGFYFRVTRSGGYEGDTVIAHARQPLQNMRLIAIGGTMSLSFVPTTPGNWPFHCHFASHVGETVTLHGSPDPFTVPPAGGDAHAMPEHDKPGGHTMRGLVIGMHINPAPNYKEPGADKRRELTLLIQKKPNAFPGSQTAFGFLLQKGTEVPAKDSISIPGPILELKRNEPVRILVKNNMDEPSGVHWHGLEIESYPDGVPDFSGLGSKIMPPVAAGGTFAAEFTPPRSGTFPYHAHLHEMRQISSGMYGAIIVSDTPRDTTRDHVIVAGAGGLPPFFKAAPTSLLVNGRTNPRPLTMTVGDTNRIRIVSIHADFVLHFKFGTQTAVTRWNPLAVDGADLPVALRAPKSALVDMGPGETADFTYVPTQPGKMQLEVWIGGGGPRVLLPVTVKARGTPKPR